MSDKKTDSGAAVPCISFLADLRSRLWARCDNAYCDMISVARRDESLGWEIKVERGEFGRKELDSHTKMGELLGRHRALAEACREIDEVVKANPKMRDATESRTSTPRCYVAALFVQPDGCYSQVPWVDMWPENRDARNYMGPLPVVAHPPCQLWGAMAKVNYARWGGEHNRPGNDGGCFAAALAAVNRWGGVLEHPAKTMAWAEHGLKKPAGIGWQRSGKGWVCEVWQSAYGHRANKATWLYYVGHTPPFELRWDRPKGTHQIGFHDQRGKAANKPTIGKREANATPIEFRDELLKLAMNADAYERRCFAT